MKKFLSFLICVLAVFGLTSCGEKTEEISTDDAIKKVSETFEELGKNEDGSLKTTEEFAEEFPGVKATFAYNMACNGVSFNITGEAGATNELLTATDKSGYNGLFASVNVNQKVSSTAGELNSTTASNFFLKEGYLYTSVDVSGIATSKVKTDVSSYITEIKNEIKAEYIEPKEEVTETPSKENSENYLLSYKEMVEAFYANHQEDISAKVVTKGNLVSYVFVIDASCTSDLAKMFKLQDGSKAIPNMPDLSGSVSQTGTIEVSLSFKNDKFVGVEVKADCAYTLASLSITEGFSLGTIKYTLKGSAKISFEKYTVVYPENLGGYASLEK